MARNFNIYSFKTRDSLHLKLAGDFDGSSAHELINVLLDHSRDCFDIFIDTDGLKSVHPFGIEVVFCEGFLIVPSLPLVRINV
jgi:hypothetical protein